jgi:hypothetical protein
LEEEEEEKEEEACSSSPDSWDGRLWYLIDV